MTVYATLCTLAAVAMLIAFINSKIGRMQMTIAITAGALMLSLLMIIAGKAQWFSLSERAADAIERINFETFLLNGMLGFLLFAGGLGIKLPNLRAQKWEIATLALLGTLVSTAIIGIALWLFFQLIGIDFALIYCLLFGSLISPTDPIAVLAIVKKMKAPEQISIQIEGESLFNDGFGLVLFVTLFAIAFTGAEPTFIGISSLFLHEAIGGIIYGLAMGLLFHGLISATDDHSMELLLTLGIPTGGYVLASALGVSGPLAMVVSGILIGNWTRHTGMSPETKDHLDNFWELVDEFLNSVLFLLIGLVMLTFSFHQEDWVLMVVAIPVVLAARYLSVKLCYLGFNRFRHYNPMSVKVLTWGGLRGGLALAMAMSIPSGVMVVASKGIDVKEIILVMTYSVVVFSILVQGSTITPLLNKANRLEPEQSPE
ncbi:cation:proton antiporter [Ferrimonas aestuarii]|uniref:Sodium:proton antiporter n=1 Tax=Ferrimonas aestuarii TaxID=2569539 RepID=A0A4U1BHL8_9GAMM|nr:sodium:proton antiporter [Ferrimonas aestuarii]TKB50894.1 sodium:proton antiporter [Ferrimonas aestuarii]